MKIILEKTLRDKQLKKLMGKDYYLNPALRLILSKLKGVQRIDDYRRGVQFATSGTLQPCRTAFVYLII